MLTTPTVGVLSRISRIATSCCVHPTRSQLLSRAIWAKSSREEMHVCRSAGGSDYGGDSAETSCKRSHQRPQRPGTGYCKGAWLVQHSHRLEHASLAVPQMSGAAYAGMQGCVWHPAIDRRAETSPSEGPPLDAIAVLEAHAEQHRKVGRCQTQEAGAYDSGPSGQGHAGVQELAKPLAQVASIPYAEACAAVC